MTFFDFINTRKGLIITSIFFVLLFVAFIYYRLQVNYKGVEISLPKKEVSIPVRDTQPINTIIRPVIIPDKTDPKKTLPSIKQSNKSGDNNLNTGDNKGNIGGNGNITDNSSHIVNGDMIGGTNGNVYYQNLGRSLRETEKKSLLDNIEQRRKLGIFKNGKQFSISPCATCNNCALYESQLKEFMISQGYIYYEQFAYVMNCPNNYDLSILPLTENNDTIGIWFQLHIK